LVESIVDPSKVISDQYAAVVFHKKNGDTLVGRIGNLNEDKVDVIEDMFEPGNMTAVKRSDIESMESSNVSPMPEGLLNTFKEDEIQDLAAYLLSRGDPKSPMFR
jgi:putative heme-binding domain-containing protein